MESVWFNDNAIIMEDNEIVLCSECPCGGCEVIPSTQIYEESLSTPHYRVKIAHMSAKKGDGAIYAHGAADDCLEVVGNGITLWTDHDYDEDGITHRYGGKLCDVPKGTNVDIYLWDTAYSRILWEGTFYYCSGNKTPW